MYYCPFLKVLGESKAVCGLGLCCWPWYQVFLAQGSSDLNCSSVGVDLAAKTVSVDVKDHSTIKDANIFVSLNRGGSAD